MSKILLKSTMALIALACFACLSETNAEAGNYGLRMGGGGYFSRMPAYRPVTPTYRSNSHSVRRYTVPVYPNYRSYRSPLGGYHPRHPHLNYYRPSLVPHRHHFNHFPGRFPLHQGHHFRH